MYVHAFVERRDEEMVLIIFPDLPLVADSVEVDLVVGRLFFADGPIIQRVIDHSHWSRSGGNTSETHHPDFGDR